MVADTNNEKILALRDSWQSTSSRYKEFAKRIGLNYRSLAVLEVIHSAPVKCTVPYICSRTRYSNKKVRIIIKLLWRKGYVERHLDAAHAITEVTLTPVGKRFADENIKRLNVSLEAAVYQQSGKRINIISSLIERIESRSRRATRARL